MKKRLDVLVLEKGLATTREKAQALILSGNVLVNDEPASKVGIKVEETVLLRVRGESLPFVSRGGLKLDFAFKEFSLNPEHKVALDVGASTGGFTDVLLQRGAKLVYAIDVGHSQLDWKIRSDERVKVFEKINARSMKPIDLGVQDHFFDILVIDVSFISLTKIIENLLVFTHDLTDWVVLIKPQFEIGKGLLGKNGIVTSEEQRTKVVKEINEFAERFGLILQGLVKSPITGTEGNIEYLAHWKRKAVPTK